jgi:hypothetical protein
MGLRHRTGYAANGEGTHGGEPHPETFATSFWNKCSTWASNMNHYTKTYYASSPQEINWIGEVGVTRCKPGMHALGRAFDLTRIQFVGTNASDMNWSWKDAQSIGHRRRYLGIAANCRRYFITVLTAWYPDSDHNNHIHFDDNGNVVPPIRDNQPSDTSLVQAACKYLNNESLTIDSVWGPITDAAYHRLLDDFGMDNGNYSPRYNVSDALLFLEFIVKHGCANKEAGRYHV